MATNYPIYSHPYRAKVMLVKGPKGDEYDDSNIRREIAALTGATPLVASDVSEMTDTTKIYVNTTDGHWYYYNGSTWEDAGVYEATELADGAVTHSKIAGSEITTLADNTKSIADYRELVLGYWGTDGTFHSNAISGAGLKYCTDYLPVGAGVYVYTKACDATVHCFDSSKTYISKATASQDTTRWLTPANTAYVRINVGYVTGTTEYNTSLFKAIVGSNYAVPFTYTVDQLYERSNCYIGYYTDRGGGVYVDWAAGKVIIKQCLGCTVYNNKTATSLYSSSTPTDFVLYDYSEYGTSSNRRLFWDSKNCRIDGSVSAINGIRELGNEMIPLGFIRPDYKTAYISGLGMIGRGAEPCHVYYRPTNPDEKIRCIKSGTTIKVDLPTGRLYFLEKGEDYRRSYQVGGSYILDSSTKLKCSPGNPDIIYTETLSTDNANTSNGMDHLLLLNVDGRLVAGDLVSQITWEDASDNINSDSFPELVFSSSTTLDSSDHTFVGDELWVFNGSNDEHSDYAACTRLSVDFENKTIAQLGTFQHNFGHCNTVDYCEATDTMILGNGGNSTNTEPDQIFIIENASDMKNNAQNSLANVAKVIDLDDLNLDWGKQINVCWGDDNNGKYNIAYVLSNDGTIKYIHKILLGKGSNQLTYGTMLTVGANEFNGTFSILGEYETDYSTTICNQGSQFYRGHLYEGIGHDGAWIHKDTLTQDGKILRTSYQQRFYDDAGSIISQYHEGIAIKDDYAIIRLSSPNRMAVYKI